MKIAYFIETVIPSNRANTVHVMKMCEALSKEGGEVTLFCDMDNEAVSIEEINRRYGINHPFSIVQMRINKYLRKYGHRFAGIWSAYKKTRRFDCSAFDVAYGRSVYALNYIKNKIPFVYESHTEPIGQIKRMESKLLRNANCKGLVVISEALKNRYIELFPEFPKENITVLHDCANVEDHSNGEVAQLKKKSDAEVVIGYLGSLYPGKCMEVMIPVAKSRPEYLFHVVGGNKEWIDKWTTDARASGVNNIIFYGFVDNAKIGSYYRNFDICILPFGKNVFVDKSKRLNIGRWISPLKLFEAMAYAKAILVSDIPTIREVLTDEENCLFADPDNIEEWGEKLDRLVGDAELRTRLGNAAKEELMRNYTWEIRAERVLQIFNRKG